MKHYEVHYEVHWARRNRADKVCALRSGALPHADRRAAEIEAQSLRACRESVPGTLVPLVVEVVTG